MKIDSYQFGRITIDGHPYANDIIILPDNRVQDGWWRRHGHHLRVEDIENLVEEAPQIIIAGTGAYGRMTIDAAVERLLRSKKIELVAEPTPKAVDVFNQLVGQRRIGAGFHLTC